MPKIHYLCFLPVDFLVMIINIGIMKRGHNNKENRLNEYGLTITSGDIEFKSFYDKAYRVSTGDGGYEYRLSPDQLKTVYALASCLTMDQIAHYFGINPNTMLEIRKKQSEIDRAYKAGLSNVINDIANNLITKAKKGDTAAICFFLKTRAGWRETNRVEQVGKHEHTHKVKLHDIDLSQFATHELETIRKLGIDIEDSKRITSGDDEDIVIDHIDDE
jgi:hypothetical protein